LPGGEAEAKDGGEGIAKYWGKQVLTEGKIREARLRWETCGKGAVLAVWFKGVGYVYSWQYEVPREICGMVAGW
jgi:hypothetical protein